ncbi:MAG TPA: hypothetical protein VMR45_00480 [Patescibacteria group bacterium]|nr:hypothetical protein [Patescibacteria group bacterium]
MEEIRSSSVTPVGALGESLTNIMASQSPEPTEEIVTELTTVQQQLEGGLDPSSARTQRILLPLGEAVANLVRAAEAQITLNTQLTDYLARIGWDGSAASEESTSPHERVVSESTPVSDSTEAAFKERAGPKDTYFAVGEDGTILPRDPITGDIMHPGEIPPSLLDDPELRAGFEFWKGPGRNVPFKLLLTLHGSGSDLRNAAFNLHAEAKQLGKAGGVLFLESIATVAYNAKLRRQYNNTSHMSSLLAKVWLVRRGSSKAYAEEDGFESELFSQVQATGVDVELPDLCSDGQRPADRALMNWRRTADGAHIFTSKRYNPTQTDKRLRCDALEMGITYYRDMYFIGKMGAELARRHAAGRLSGGAALVVGRLHENIAARLSDTGVAAEMVGKLTDRKGRLLIDYVRDCKLTPQDSAAIGEAMQE